VLLNGVFRLQRIDVRTECEARDGIDGVAEAVLVAPYAYYWAQRQRIAALALSFR
jgi:hypothetical protein